MLRLQSIGAVCLLLTGVSASAELLGVTPNEPTIGFGGNGIVEYDAASREFTLQAEPSNLFRSDPFLDAQIVGRSTDDARTLSLRVQLDANGQFVGGVTGPDLQVVGSVDVDFDGVADFDGVLLEAEVTGFGFRDGGTADDTFDLRLGLVTGVLASFFAGQDLAITVTSEISAEFPEPFTGSFASSWRGQAKGTLGAIAVEVPIAACKVDVEATCRIDGQSRERCKCRIPVAKSQFFWDVEDRVIRGKVCKRWKYGLHGNPLQNLGRRHRSTPVTFTYVVRNTGPVPVLNLTLDDSFEGELTNVPLVLDPGQSFTTRRTVNLSEAVNNVVTVVGDNGAGLSCGDSDTVVVSQRLKVRRRHHDDDFRDKGRWDAGFRGHGHED
jgi:hypothetical protein